MTISGRKSVKKGQNFFAMANRKYIIGYNMMKKNLVSLHNFRTYFFPLGEVNASFLNLLTRANNYSQVSLKRAARI